MAYNERLFLNGKLREDWLSLDEVTSFFKIDPTTQQPDSSRELSSHSLAHTELTVNQILSYLNDESPYIRRLAVARLIILMQAETIDLQSIIAPLFNLLPTTDDILTRNYILQMFALLVTNDRYKEILLATPNFISSFNALLSPRNHSQTNEFLIFTLWILSDNYPRVATSERIRYAIIALTNPGQMLPKDEMVRLLLGWSRNRNHIKTIIQQGGDQALLSALNKASEDEKRHH